MGRELRYYLTQTDSAPRDVIYLAAGTRIDVGGGVKDTGGAVGGGGGGGTADWPWAAEARGRIVTPLCPANGPYRDARLAILSIFHPNSPNKVYQFSCFAPPGNNAAVSIVREQAQRWALVMRAAVAGVLDPPLAAARISVVLRSGLKLASVSGMGAALSAQSQLPVVGSAPVGSGAGARITVAKTVAVVEVEAGAGEGAGAGTGARARARTEDMAAVAASASMHIGGVAAVAPPPTVATNTLVGHAWLPGAVGERCKALTAELQCLSTGDGGGRWTANGSSGGVTCWRTTDGTPGARGDARFPYSRAIVLATILAPNERPKYDNRGIEGRRVESLDELTSIVYFNFKAAPFVSGRDFLLLTHVVVDRDGAVWVATGSTTHANTPARSGIVRAVLHVGGWLLRPVAPGADGIEKECDVTYAMRSDLCGSLPLALTATVTSSQAMLTGGLLDYLIKKHGSNPPLLAPLKSSVYGGGQVTVPVAAAETAFFITHPRPSWPPPSAALPAAITPLPHRLPPPPVPVHSASLPLWVAVTLLVVPALYKLVGVTGLFMLCFACGLTEARRRFGRVFREPLLPTPMRTEAAIALRIAAANARSPKEGKDE